MRWGVFVAIVSLALGCYLAWRVHWMQVRIDNLTGNALRNTVALRSLEKETDVMKGPVDRSNFTLPTGASWAFDDEKGSDPIPTYGELQAIYPVPMPPPWVELKTDGDIMCMAVVTSDYFHHPACPLLMSCAVDSLIDFPSLKAAFGANLEPCPHCWAINWYAKEE